MIDMEIGKNMLHAFSGQNNPQPKLVEQKTEPTKEATHAETKTDDEVKEIPANQLKPNSDEKRVQTEDVKTEKQTEDVQQEVKSVEIDDNAILSYFKEKKGKEINSLDELFKEPEPVVDPFEGLSEDATQFIKYNKETGRSFEEFQALNRDYTKTDSIELAREKAIAISDGYLDKDNVDEYLEQELNIDLSDLEDMSPVEKVKLKNYSSDYLKAQLELKEKYKQPVERANQPEMVTLQNGQQMPKETYEKLVSQQEQYQKSIKEASDKITASAYDIKIDDNGTEKTMNVGYEYTKDEVQDMASSALNIDGFYQKAFGTDKGIDYAKLQEGLHWADPKKREKSITAIVHKALAKQAEEFAALEHNAGVKTKSMPNGKTAKSEASLLSWRGGGKQGIGFSPDQF